MNSIQILPDALLSAVVGATNVHGELRQRTGMCGCGVLPDPGSVHAH